MPANGMTRVGLICAALALSIGGSGEAQEQEVATDVRECRDEYGAGDSRVHSDLFEKQRDGRTGYTGDDEVSPHGQDHNHSERPVPSHQPRHHPDN